MDDIERHGMYYPGAEGCSDGGCIFKDNSKGMRTNGGCKCEKELRRHPQGFNAIQTINFLRGQLRKTVEETESLRTKLAEAEKDAERYNCFIDALTNNESWAYDLVNMAADNGCISERTIDSAIQQAKMRGEG